MNFGPSLCDVIPRQRLDALRVRFPRGPIAYFLRGHKPQKPWSKTRHCIEIVCDIIAAGLAGLMLANFHVHTLPKLIALFHD